jgi:hypothetical protein
VIKKFVAIVSVYLCLAASGACALPLEATAVKAFPAMKSEESFLKLLQLLRQDDVRAAADYLKAEGQLMRDGTEVVLTEVGCDGLCVKFHVKGEEAQYWTVPTMDGREVFKFKK